MFATSQHAHFIGIGGIGMSGIAEILLNLGMKVSGSDLKRSAVTDRLAALGATIYEGHNAANVAGSDGGRHQLGSAREKSRGARGARAQNSRDSARGDAGRAHAAQIRHRHRRHARQNHDHFDGGRGAELRAASILRSSWAAAWTRSARTRGSAPRNILWPRPTRATARSSSSRPSSPWSPISTASTWIATTTWPTWSAPLWTSWTACRSTAPSRPASTTRCSRAFCRASAAASSLTAWPRRPISGWNFSMPRNAARARAGNLLLALPGAHRSRSARPLRTPRSRPAQCAQRHRRRCHRPAT